MGLNSLKNEDLTGSVPVLSSHCGNRTRLYFLAAMTSTEAARESLRRQHGVRLVSSTLEGASAEHLPAGVYGFTGSPLLASPLFAVRNYRNFEVHRLASTPVLIGFVSAADAARLAESSDTAATVRVYPDAEADATTIVAIPYNRVAQHRQYSVRNAEALTLQVHATHALTTTA